MEKHCFYAQFAIFLYLKTIFFFFVLHIYFFCFLCMLTDLFYFYYNSILFFSHFSFSSTFIYEFLWCDTPILFALIFCFLTFIFFKMHIISACMRCNMHTEIHTDIHIFLKASKSVAVGMEFFLSGAFHFKYR